MGLDVNTIRSGLKFCISRTKDGTKVVRPTHFVQLPKNSKLRDLGFSEITHNVDGWSLRGENVFEWFSSDEKEKLQKFLREYTTGTTVTKLEDKIIVKFGDNNRCVNKGFLGFIKDKYNGFTVLNTKCGGFRFEWYDKSKMKTFLKKIFSEIDTKQKWSNQELDKRLCNDFSEEIIKPVHDYLEGKLSKKELLNFIKKYRKNMSYNPSLEESLAGQPMGALIPGSFVSDKILDSLKIPKHYREKTLYDLYSLARNDNNTAKALIEEFNKIQGFSPDKRTSIYRFIGKEELNKILAGYIVKPGLHYQSFGFDVTPRTRLYDDCYRVKFNIEASEKTVPEKIFEHRCEDEYYYWRTSGYTIKDVKSIFDQGNNTFVYESDDEILSNFIDGYISKLG